MGIMGLCPGVGVWLDFEVRLNRATVMLLGLVSEHFVTNTRSSVLVFRG